MGNSVMVRKLLLDRHLEATKHHMELSLYDLCQYDVQHPSNHQQLHAKHNAHVSQYYLIGPCERHEYDYKRRVSQYHNHELVYHPRLCQRNKHHHKRHVSQRHLHHLLSLLLPHLLQLLSQPHLHPQLQYHHLLRDERHANLQHELYHHVLFLHMSRRLNDLRLHERHHRDLFLLMRSPFDHLRVHECHDGHLDCVRRSQCDANDYTDGNGYGNGYPDGVHGDEHKDEGGEHDDVHSNGHEDGDGDEHIDDKCEFDLSGGRESDECECDDDGGEVGWEGGLGWLVGW